MKKIFCVMLTAVMAFCSVICGVNAVAEQEGSRITAEEFAAEVARLTINDESDNPFSSTSNAEPTCGEEFSCSRLIVKSRRKIDTLNASTVISGFDDLWVLQFSSPDDAAIAYEYYSTRSGIDFVEPDREINALGITETEYVSYFQSKEYLSWGPEHIGMDILNAAIIESEKELSDCYVAVIDTGVDPNHPFLKGRVIPTRINVSSGGNRNDSMDDNGHGTQVAGVIADCTLDNVYIKPYKVLNSKGFGTVITVAAGINCAINDKVDVINISVGFEEESDVLKAAIDKAELNDIFVVGAAGNTGSDNLLYPASYDYVLKISALNQSNVVCNFSTYGDDIDFAAPGYDILTTTLNNGYVSVNGTSFAAPFVSAVAATVRMYFPDASSEDIYNFLSDIAMEINEADSSEKCGNGLIYAYGTEAYNYFKAKTETPVFSLDSNFYYSDIDLTISCDTPGSTIYYTTDKSVPSKTNPNAKIYDGTPIHASQTIAVMAVAYCPGFCRSSFASFGAIIAPYADENDLVVDETGSILSYSGEYRSLSIPETVNGIKVTSVGNNAFKGKNITEILLPESVTIIGTSAFEDCTELKTIRSKGLTYIGDRALYNCISLKNLFIDDLQSIGNYSFYNVCTKQFLYSGTTFNIDLSHLTVIPEGSFMNSSVSTISLGSVTSIGKNAFLECTELVSFYADNIMNMPDGAFKGCSSLSNVEIKGLSYVPSAAFSCCENLVSVSLPDARFVNSNAFESCVSLTSVNLPEAKTVYSNAFSGCKMLDYLKLPSMTAFEDTIYGNSETKPSLPPNLQTFIAPNLISTVPDMFNTAPNVKNIFLNSATNIAEYTFRGCYDIYYINLESVETLKSKSLTYCSAQFIDLRSLVSTDDLPDNSGVMLSNNFIESSDKAENLTVYGTPGTFVERYSILKGYDFSSIPYIVNEIPEYITENSESVAVYAVGFDLEYQWYWNTEASTEGGTPIEGATANTYTFTHEDTAPYYYCVITQNDLGTVAQIKTPVITKDFIRADYTEYDAAVERANSLDRRKYADLSELDTALSINVRDLYSCEQSIVDAQTKAINDAIDNLKLKIGKTVTLYSSDLDLRLFESVRIIAVIDPVDALYEKIEWTSSDTDVVLISKNGYARCVGKGIAVIKATVTNADGSIIENTITIDCSLTSFEEFIAFLIRPIFIIADKINRIKML
ncbi:MAG: leucine-rich repeat protein [Oscillospiraceae bacterium]|nr:leucine-rich repeat protein [Oscillospiraceae bacterium]